MSSARYDHHSAVPHPPSASTAPPGTFAPGTKVQVGGHRVVIEKYLSEGGFAHVYVVRLPQSGDGPDVAVLKRVAVPDKDALANMRTEVETMKKLKGHRHIVTYIDSHASQLKGGGYEVFLLMEYCSGGGLIDFMNTRLQNRLTEPEILHIFSDAAEGVATMHYLRPPLLHRDLKVENVLITAVGSSKTYKLCDFGSTAPPRPAARTAAEGRLIEEEVQRHTTLQYRSPEMIDVYRKQPINEKSDIWALGVLLYKLCYYTTPFEEQGQMAILNASFKYPPYPQFSDRLRKLIASMLRENPQHRPNIYQVMVEVCAMRHRDVPIKDIYSSRSHSEARRSEQLPPTESTVSSPPGIGLQKSPAVKQVQSIPEITPMRRGRPTGPSQQQPSKPGVSPMRGAPSDPFAALDSQNLQVRSAAADELAARFPSLDEFSLLHDRGQKFQFGQPPASEPPPQENINKRVTEALADDAFAFVPATKVESAPTKPSTAQVTPVARSVSVKKPRANNATQDAVPPSRSPIFHQPIPQRHRMVSTGMQTSPPPSPASASKQPDLSNRPIYRFPPKVAPGHHNRIVNQPQSSDPPHASSSSPYHSRLPARPTLVETGRSKSQTATLTIPKSPASSRPSLESQRPSALDVGDPIGRSKSANSRPRPTSVHVESNLDYLRDREMVAARLLASNEAPDSESESDPEPDDKNIASNVEFLRAMEAEEPSSAREASHRHSSSGSSKHGKRSSLTSLSLSTTKTILAGKFGDAFRKFETNAHHSPAGSPADPTTPIDVRHHRGGTKQPPTLTPIAGSVATLGPSADAAVDSDLDSDSAQALSPEVRRELERRRLSAEEKRVAKAAAEYRERIAQQPAPPTSTRAATIQNRVKELLDDSKKASTTRTAEGYGPYSDAAKTLPSPSRARTEGSGSDIAGELAAKENPVVMRKAHPKSNVPTIGPTPVPAPVGAPASSATQDRAEAIRAGHGPPGPSASAPPTSSSIARSNPASGGANVGKPCAPPKPKALRTGSGPNGPGGARGPLPSAAPVRGGTSAAALGGNVSTNSLASAQLAAGDSAEDWEANFVKRYPSLSGLEMVETEIGIGINSSSGGASRDVAPQERA